MAAVRGKRQYAPVATVPHHAPKPKLSQKQKTALAWAVALTPPAMGTALVGAALILNHLQQQIDPYAGARNPGDVVSVQPDDPFKEVADAEINLLRTTRQPWFRAVSFTSLAACRIYRERKAAQLRKVERTHDEDVTCSIKRNGQKVTLQLQGIYENAKRAHVLVEITDRTGTRNLWAIPKDEFDDEGKLTIFENYFNPAIDNAVPMHWQGSKPTHPNRYLHNLAGKTAQPRAEQSVTNGIDTEVVGTMWETNSGKRYMAFAGSQGHHFIARADRYLDGRSGVDVAVSKHDLIASWNPLGLSR
jgi:hypothetical protein